MRHYFTILSHEIRTLLYSPSTYIGLEPGGDERNLQPGQVITQTQSAVVLENLIGQFLFNKAADAGTAAASGSKP